MMRLVKDTCLCASTITSRSLPDVRDGLKPGIGDCFSQCANCGSTRSQVLRNARVVGDVIEEYHPHGDVAVYDALVRLAQDFAVRYPR